MENKHKIVEISTRLGKMYVWLYPQTPKHKENFLKLANDGFFNGTTFHRVIENFVVQGGDPLSKDANARNVGTGGPGYTIPAEINDNFKHEYGALSAARQADQVNPRRESSGSQFYIVVNKNGTGFLDGQYTVFGKVLKGMETAENIVAEPNSGNPHNQPLERVEMQVKVIEKTTEELKNEFGFSASEA